jgi:hypothetical protein
MEAKTFDKIVEHRIESIQGVLGNKAKEYSSAQDRLHNFKVAAKLSREKMTPEQALFGMMRKHLVSVIDIVENTEKGICPSAALREEKIGDSINYLILLEALLVERGYTQPIACNLDDHIMIRGISEVPK